MINTLLSRLNFFTQYPAPPKYWKRMMKRAQGNKTFISSSEAKKLGYSNIHFSWRGIGDQILLLGAAEEYFNLTGEKLLLAVDEPEIFIGSTSCYVLTDYSPDSFWKEFNRSSKSDLLLKGGVFTLNFLNSGFYKNKTLIFPKVPMMGMLLKHLGISGRVNCSPSLHLSESEKRFGHFSNKQICVMTGGNVPYKILPFEIMQEVVNALNGEYLILQIGASKDKPLAGAENLCGISLRKSAAVLSASNAFVGTIGGLMHLAESVGCPSVIASGAEPDIYCKYTDHIHVKSNPYCKECEELGLNPLFDKCPNCYRCIREIKSIEIVQAIIKILENPIREKTFYEIKQADRINGIDGLFPYLESPPAIRVL